MSLVVFTALVGVVLAPGSMNPFLAFVSLLSIACGSGAAGAFNMWYDRDIDIFMSRTKTRPIPAGRIRPDDAIAFSLLLMAVSVFMLGLAANWLAAALLAFSIFYYAVIYTMLLKRRTPANIVIGGAAGAFPPVIGWLAAGGELSLFPVLMFLIIFFWTPPHFWALAIRRTDDYAKVNVPMLPSVSGIHATKRKMAQYLVLLLGTSLLPYFMGFSGYIYACSAAVLGARFMYYMIQVMISTGEAEGKKSLAMFFYSIAYLFALFTALLVDGMLLALQE